MIFQAGAPKGSSPQILVQELQNTGRPDFLTCKEG